MSKYKQSASSYLSDLPLTAAELDKFEEIKLRKCVIVPSIQILKYKCTMTHFWRIMIVVGKMHV